MRLLLWEIARLRGVIKVLYRQIVRLTPYSADTIQVPLDEAVEEAMEEEPAILEEAGRTHIGRKHAATPMAAHVRGSGGTTTTRRDARAKRS